MKTISTHRGLALALAIAGMITTRAAAINYQWTPGQIQGLGDVTAAFHGGAGQLSTIDSITPIPNGVELGVTFRIGQEADPFGADYGLGFARVSLAGGLGFPGLDLGLFSGSSVMITTTIGITAQSFLQTDFTEDGGTIDDGDGTPGESFSFLFWEHNDSVAAGGPSEVEFDFSSGTEFDGNWGLSNPQQVQGTDAIRQWGLQLAKFSDMTIGVPVEASILIENLPVPEPSSAALVGLSCAALLVLRPRKK